MGNWLLTAALLLAQAGGFTKDDVVKMAKAGISDDVIIAKIDQEKATFDLSAEDLASLKSAGVSERVLRRMTSRSPAAAAAPDEPSNLIVRNHSHREIRVSLNAAQRTLDLSASKGEAVAPGGSMGYGVNPGEYRVQIAGGSTIYKVLIGATAGAAVTIRGAETAYIDVLTATISDGAGETILILHSEGRRVPGEVPRSGYSWTPRNGFYGPQYTYLPYVSSSVLLGAGIGAIIGHQSGHRTEGALVGAAAGLLLDWWSYGGGWGW